MPGLKNIMTDATKKQQSGGHSKAFRRWFVRTETARKAARLSPGRLPRDLPPAPTSPDELRRLALESVGALGEARSRELLGVHRTTFRRWLSGESQVPQSAALVLRLLADGLHPLASEEWCGFRFAGDDLILPDGRRYTAREIQGFHYLQAALDASQRKSQALEATVVELTRRIDWGSANDPFTQAQDPRARAFSEQ
jgi:hypothetical protein